MLAPILVEAVPKGGAVENLYFDVETGVKLPFKITQVLPAMRFVITFDDIKQNVPVDDAMFLRP